MKTIIIAEAGVNHNGILKKALKMVDIASRAKADFICWGLNFKHLFQVSFVKQKLIAMKYQKKF